ncbi:hypothetical protein FISHEDRAFT_69032 [Fistulina hepatica ATCC 64428]|uniref:Uncharacterized protein n=1 Tax=Fistulina hepatica ATCC 64428 TaxID=1128425 RepID=A0A0D7AN81_9AGAR|nr:hypothetical protein FISHEDRAFT_69032 [Fistulina hepatica ATCC 64428]
MLEGQLTPHGSTTPFVPVSLDEEYPSVASTVRSLLHGRRRSDVPVDNEHPLVIVPIDSNRQPSAHECPWYDVVLFVDTQEDTLLLGDIEWAWICQVACWLKNDLCAAEGMGVPLRRGGLSFVAVMPAYVIEMQIPAPGVVSTILVVVGPRQWDLPLNFWVSHR